MAVKPGSGFYKWISNTIFTNEELKPKEKSINSKLPPILQQARLMEKEYSHLPHEKLFLAQGDLLADYTDDYRAKNEIFFNYPTYQTLSDKQLRSYFTCRTQLRNGDFSWAPESFIYIYGNEIINNIGIKSPQEGYEKLIQLKNNWALPFGYFPYYLDRWIHDYVIYYNLDPALLNQDPDEKLNKEFSVLDNILDETPEDIIKAISALAPGWIGRSRFYKEYSEDMNAVIINVVKKMFQHYGKKCKGPLTEQFGRSSYYDYYCIFQNAVFANPIPRESYEYQIPYGNKYIYENHDWAVRGYYLYKKNLKKLEKILKTIDKIMRDKYGYASKIKAEISTKWQLKLINEEIDALLNRKKEAKRKKINLGALEKIRQDADYTKEKLAIEEEATADDPVMDEPVQLAKSEISENEFNLTPMELKFVHCLLYEENIDWVKAEGLIISVLVDSVNEKLFEKFEDSVLDDQPSIIPDYLSEMKELFSI